MRELRAATAAALLVIVLVFSTRLEAQAPRYDVGRAPRPSDVRAGDYAIAPDGRGLPPGHGTVGQGRVVYARSCASCHGERGQGAGEYPALVGGRGTLAGKAPVQTVGSYWPYATTVWDYIHRAMPYPSAGSLSDDEVYAVTAYILHLNGIVPANADLNARSLASVRMPNRDGFVRDPRPDVGGAKTPRSGRTGSRDAPPGRSRVGGLDGRIARGQYMAAPHIGLPCSPPN